MRYRWGVCAALVLACFGFACSTKEQQWDLEDVLQKVLPQPSSLTKACNGKRLFQAPLHVGEILDYVAKWDAQNPVRKTRAFDCFSGFGNVGSVYRAAGHRCPGFDYEFNGLQDLTCREGFFAALEMFWTSLSMGSLSLAHRAHYGFGCHAHIIAGTINASWETLVKLM